MIYRFGDCELDDQRYELRRGGALVHLEPQVFEVLAYLARHRDRVVPKTELLDQIWGSRFVSESALTSRLKAARRAVGDSGREQRVIGTVHGRGYRFLAPVRETGATPAGVVDSRGRALSGSATLPPRGAESGGGSVQAVPAPAPALVGREVELERLGELYRLAERGRRQVVFVTGEAGIGKTTLVEGFAAAAGRVARGQCLEQRGAPEPYLPVFDALDRLCRDDAEALGWLSRLAPTWLVQMPALVGEADRED
ncbi:MAG: ATPase-like protein, partial [Actinomycetia bacterium]|nr:ATPase-like protein [Actinomycetes bacterium]